MNPKSPSELRIEDVRAYPVWQYCVADNEDGIGLLPVTEKGPLQSLDERIVATQVCLANGTFIWGVLFGLDSYASTFSENDTGLVLFLDDSRAELGRAWERHLPGKSREELAAHLGLPTEDVFPITFDVSSAVLGNSSALSGMFT
jgi:hypothetical protein